MELTKGIPIKSADEGKCQAILFYSYKLLDFMKKECFSISEINIISELLKKFDKEKQCRAFLDLEISTLMRKKQLTKSSDNILHYKSLKYSFCEDSIIKDKYSYYTISELSINILRCYYSSFNSHFLKRLFDNVFFSDKEFKKNCKAKAYSLDEVTFINKSFKLSKLELELIHLLYLRYSIKEFGSINIKNHDVESLPLLSVMLGCDYFDLQEILKTNKPLMDYGLIEEHGIILSYRCFNAIKKQDINEYFYEVLNEEDITQAIIELDSFKLEKEKIQVMMDLLKSNKPVSILLYGAPGAGKTEFSKAICKACSKKPYIYDIRTELGDTKNSLKWVNFLLRIKKKDAVYIIDEADNLLHTKLTMGFFSFGGASKSYVNSILDDTKSKSIWIVNYDDQIDESTKRRFTYSIKFPEMPKEMILNILKTKLNNFNLSKGILGEIIKVCERYHITGASIENTVKAIGSLNHKNETQIITRISTLLEANSSLVFGNQSNSIRETVKESYDLSVLNTTYNPTSIVKMVESAIELGKSSKDHNSGIRILFYGLSGTGKTELARYIAEKIGKRILIKRLSDIFGEYVGENEQNIRNAFREAAAEDKILLFDEADSFFYDRTSANASWERNTVNEFLTQMEEFSGILICTTNLRNIMDPAIQRRFHLAVEFKALQEDGIEKLLNKFFSENKFTTSQIDKLTSYNTVTPGDFGALSSRVRFIPSDEISSDYIISELIKLQEEKSGQGSRRIGFTV